MKLADLIREHEITLTFVHGAPPDPSPTRGFEMNPWTVTLHRPGARDYTVPFYMGPGIVDQNNKKPVWNAQWGQYERVPQPAKPDVIRVLDCQLSDASTVEQTRGFEDWCSDLGYSADSIKARDMYRACTETALRLRQFLGEHYETFMYCERE